MKFEIAMSAIVRALIGNGNKRGLPCLAIANGLHGMSTFAVCVFLCSVLIQQLALVGWTSLILTPRLIMTYISVIAILIVGIVVQGFDYDNEYDWSAVVKKKSEPKPLPPVSKCGDHREAPAVQRLF